MHFYINCFVFVFSGAQSSCLRHPDPSGPTFIYWRTISLYRSEHAFGNNKSKSIINGFVFGYSKWYVFPLSFETLGLEPSVQSSFWQKVCYFTPLETWKKGTNCLGFLHMCLSKKWSKMKNNIQGAQLVYINKLS